VARLDYVDASDDPGVQEVIERIKDERGGNLHNLFKMLLNSPPVAAGYLGLGTAIRYRSSLDGRMRELAICEVARLTGSDYEWLHHAPAARQEGLTDEQLAALPDWQGATCFDAREQAVLAYADQMTIRIKVDDLVFDALRHYFTAQDIVELTATVATYNLVARFLIALLVDLDEDR
jgi:alkylhydroperoxidase family enzyme